MAIRQHDEGAGRIGEALFPAGGAHIIRGAPAGGELQAARVQHGTDHGDLVRPLRDGDQVPRLQQHIEVRAAGEDDRIRLHHHPPGGAGLAEAGGEGLSGLDRPGEIPAAARPGHRLPGGDLDEALFQLPRGAGEAFLLALAHAVPAEHRAIGIGLGGQPAGPGDDLGQPLPTADVIDPGAEEFTGEGDRADVPVPEAARQAERIPRGEPDGGEIAAAEVKQGSAERQGRCLLRRFAGEFDG